MQQLFGGINVDLLSLLFYQVSVGKVASRWDRELGWKIRGLIIGFMSRVRRTG